MLRVESELELAHRTPRWQKRHCASPNRFSLQIIKIGILNVLSWRRKDALAKKKLQVADVPWRPANPPKKAGGLGLGNLSSHFGTVDYKGVRPPIYATMNPAFRHRLNHHSLATGAKTPAFPEGGRIEYQPVGTAAKLKKGDVQFSLPNILTNPIKKVPSAPYLTLVPRAAPRAQPHACGVSAQGHFGINNTTIGVPCAAAQRRAWRGVTNEYAYMPDPYDGAK